MLKVISPLMATVAMGEGDAVAKKKALPCQNNLRGVLFFATLGRPHYLLGWDSSKDQYFRNFPIDTSLGAFANPLDVGNVEINVLPNDHFLTFEILLFIKDLYGY